jgi:hypothetical protein
MAIGTTVKVGFDATQVKSGFSALKSMFSGALRGFRQVGIGAARQVGAQVTDLLGRVIMAIPQGIKDTADWADNLNDMSNQTGVAVSKLVLMEEALRLSGAEAADTSRMISMLASNLHEAQMEAGPARDALNKLGLFMPDMAGLSVDQAFEKIGRQVATLPNDFKGLEGIMSDLFGAKMGFKLIRFFRDYDGGMKQATNNVGAFASRIEVSAEAYGKLNDAAGRFEMRWRETMAVVLDELVAMFGDDWLDQMFDFFAPEKIRAGIAFLKTAFTDFAKWASEGGFKTIFKDIGRAIGEGVMESMKGILPFGTSGGAIDYLKGLMPGAKTDDKTSKLISQGDMQVALLRQIAMKQTGWA